MFEDFNISTVLLIKLRDIDLEDLDVRESAIASVSASLCAGAYLLDHHAWHRGQLREEGRVLWVSVSMREDAARIKE